MLSEADDLLVLPHFVLFCLIIKLHMTQQMCASLTIRASFIKVLAAAEAQATCQLRQSNTVGGEKEKGFQVHSRVVLIYSGAAWQDDEQPRSGRHLRPLCPHSI